MDRNQVVTVINFTSGDRAELAKSLLESAGIESQLVNETSAQVIPSLPNSIRLMVNEADRERAEEVLRAEFGDD